MIYGLFWLLVANAAALLGARALVAGMRVGRAADDVVLFLLVRLTLISVAVGMAGFFGILTPLGVGLLGAAALAFLLAIGAHRGLRWPRLPAAGRLVLLAAGLLAAKLLLQVWFLAPYSPDTLSYHLPKIAEWIRAGGFVRELGVDSHASFPAGFELVETWWVVFLRHDALIELAGIEFLALAATATYALARHTGVPPPGAAFAALLYAMLPALQVMTTSCMNDVPATAVVLGAAALIVHRARPELVLMALGLGLGIKATAGFAYPGLLLLWLLRHRQEPRSVPFARAGAALAVLGTGLGLCWYVRNALWFGNPFHPVGADGFHDPSGERQIQSGASFSSLASNVAALVNHRLYDHAPFSTHLDSIAGWGAVAFACGLPALSVAILQRRPVVPLAAFLGISAASVFLMVIPDEWNARFILFLPVVLCIAVADMAQDVRPVSVVAWLGVILQFVATPVPADLAPAQVRSFLEQGWRERSAASDAVRTQLPSGPVGFLADLPAPAYLFYGPDFSRRVVYLRSDTPEGLTAEVEQAGLRSLYAVPISRERLDFVLRGEREGRFRRIGGGLLEVHGPAGEGR